jgi:aminocarboxymuconate-semialdehyde decarboxylase
MKIVDVHNHLYPREWMEYLRGRPGSPTMEQTGPTNFIFSYEGMRLATVSVPGHYDPEARIADIDRYGIDVQMLSLTTPGVEMIPAAEGVPWAKKVNDFLAELCRRYKGRYYMFAALPYQDAKESVKEMERAVKELGARVITMFSNIKGEPIYAPRFTPIYEAAESLGLPVFIHPAPPITTDALKRVEMPLPLYGFIFDTTMAVTGLIFKGFLDRFPGLRIIHSHLGGVFPYLVGRIDDCFRTYAKDFGFSLDRDPAEYYRENVYVDAISFHVPAMKCALDYLGADHIMIGTDYAHPIGGPERVTAFVDKLGLGDADRAKIFHGNAEKLFGI